MNKINITVFFIICFFSITPSFAITNSQNSKKLQKVTLLRKENTSAPVQNIIKILPDNRRIISNDGGATWRDIGANYKSYFNVYSKDGKIIVKSDTLFENDYRINVFNIYGVLIDSQKIGNKEIAFKIHNQKYSLIIYRIEKDGVVIQKGKFVLND